MRNYECAGIGDYTVAITIPISAEKMGRVIVPISPDCLLPPVPAGNCAYLESSSDLGSFCTSPPPGNEIVYTGHGGRDENTGQQKANQTFTRGNAALARNEVLGLPVRVVRGFEPDSPFAPEQGYRYDGSTRWMNSGKRPGFRDSKSGVIGFASRRNRPNPP